MQEALINLIGFILMILIQGLVINGIFECFRGGCVQDMNKGRVCSGNIFYKINPEFFERHKGKNWTMPLWGCVRCMASFWGALTYWPIVLMMFGWQWQELPVFAADAFCLVTVNWLIYKKL